MRGRHGLGAVMGPHCTDGRGRSDCATSRSSRLAAMRIMTLIWTISQARMTGDGNYESTAIVQVAVVACGELVTAANVHSSRNAFISGIPTVSTRKAKR